MKNLTSLFVSFLFTLTIFAQATKWDLNGNNSGSNDFIGTTNSQALVFKTDNEVRLKISNDGNVTVKDLESLAGHGIVKVNGNGKLGRVDYPNDPNYFLDGNGNFSSHSVITPWVINTNFVTLDASKKVGIGITNPTHKFEVLGDAKVHGMLYVADSIKIGDSSVVITGNSIYATNNGGGGFGQGTLNINQGYPAYGVNGGTTLINRFAGKVGIGTSNPTNKLTIRDGADNNLSIGADVLNGNVGILISSHKDFSNGPKSLAFASSDVKFYVSGQSTHSVVIKQDGKVIIGSPSNITSTPSGYKLFVDEGILTEKVKVSLCCGTDWSDFVFNPDYMLLSLDSVETYINYNCHLPGVPSADEMVVEGIDVAKMDALLLQKIEELTLYVIQIGKENKELKIEIENLKKK